MKNKSILIAIVAFFIFIQISNIMADGGYFPPPGYWVRPGEQRAIIFHENNVETLILTSSFQGNAKDLVWIIPTPTKPEITKANEEVFTNIAKLVQPQYNYGYSYGTMLKAAAGGAEQAGVVVIESKKVDYYDVKVVVATNSQDLVNWFSDNNYQYPKEYSYVLEHYIDKGWFFTAIKVSPESQGATEVVQDLKEGHPTPVKLTFLSDKIVFPLKISSVDFPPNVKYAKDELIGTIRTINGQFFTKTGDNSWQGDTRYGGGTYTDDYIDQQPGGINYNYYYRYGDYTPIQVYIIADVKYEATDFNTQYGNWVKKSQIEKLGDDEDGNSLIQPKNAKYFLTSLNANYQKSQMDDDVFFKKSDDNKKVNAGPESWQIFIYGLIIGIILFATWIFTPPLGILFIAGCLILFLSSNKTARIFGWVMEWIALILTLTIGVIFFLLGISNNSLNNYVVILVLISILFLLILMAFLMILQANYKPKNFSKSK